MLPYSFSSNWLSFPLVIDIYFAANMKVSFQALEGISNFTAKCYLICTYLVLKFVIRSIAPNSSFLFLVVNPGQMLNCLCIMFVERLHNCLVYMKQQFCLKEQFRYVSFHSNFVELEYLVWVLWVAFKCMYSYALVLCRTWYCALFLLFLVDNNITS